MKYFALILFLASSQAYAQTKNISDSNYYKRLDFSPYGINYQRLLTNERTQNEYTTQITFFDLNFITIRVQLFLNSKLHLVSVADPITSTEKGEKTFTYKFVQGGIAYIGNVKPKPVYVKYVYFINKLGNPIIKNCKIYGSEDSVVGFYASFWPTNIHFNESGNGGTFYSFLLQDKITLTINSFKNYAEIYINNTQIKTISDYENYLAKSIENNLKQATEN